MSNVDVRRRVIDALEHFALNGEPFTLSQLRELIEVKPRTTEEYTLWNLWRAVQEAHVVEEVDTSRQRNRIYRVREPKLLNAFKPTEALRQEQKQPQKKRLGASVERRLRELEHRVAQLEEQLTIG